MVEVPPEVQLKSDTNSLRKMFNAESGSHLFCLCGNHMRPEKFWQEKIQPLIEQAEKPASHPLNYIWDSEEVLYAECEECGEPRDWGSR